MDDNKPLVSISSLVKKKYYCQRHGGQQDTGLSFYKNLPGMRTKTTHYCLECYWEMVAASCCELEEIEDDTNRDS